MIQFNDEDGIKAICAIVAMHALLQSDFPREVEDITEAAFAQAESMAKKLAETVRTKEKS